MNKKTSLKTRIAYGLGSGGEGFGYQFFYSYFIFFLSTIAGLSPTLAGTISMIAVIWDGVTDPLIGTWSDNCKFKTRRRPFIMTGSIICAISMVLLFTKVSMPTGAKFAYYCAICIIYWAALTSCVIPHASLGTDVSDDYDERNTLRGFCTFFMNATMFACTALTLILVGMFGGNAGKETRGWTLTAVLFAICLVACYQICAHGMKGVEPPNPNLAEGAGAKKVNAREVLKGYISGLKNKPLRSVLGVDFLYNFFVGTGGALGVFCYTLGFGFTDAQVALAFTIQGIAGIIFAPVVTIIANKIGKKPMIVLSMVVLGIGAALMLIFPFSWPLLVVSLFSMGFGASAFWAQGYAMVYDTTLVERYKSGDMPTGVYVALFGLVMKIGTAIGNFIGGVSMDLIGYDETAVEQAASVGKGVIGLNYGLVAGAAILGILIAMTYKLSKEKYHKLQKAVEDKENGLTPDISGLEKIL